ncbi:hypothetical protein LT493_23975 [Streptomyces tricolor]|nr:hypothetical protein [Streptomyces tricolor]
MISQGGHRGAARLAAAFGISSVPTLMIVRDQVAVYAQPGRPARAHARRPHRAGP